MKIFQRCIRPLFICAPAAMPGAVRKRPATKPLLAAALLPLVLLSQDTAGTGAIIGTLTGGQVSGLRVCLAEAARCASTDANGLFRFAGIRPGDYQLTLGLLVTPVTVRAGLSAQVQIDLPELTAPRESITVRASMFLAPEEIKTSSFLIERYEVFKSSVAEQDVSRYT